MEKQIVSATSAGFLTGKRVLIMGGSSGIGLATAKAAAAEGAQVIIVSGNQQRVNEALQQLPANSVGYAADLSVEEAIKAVITKVGAIDHLVYTAGENIKLGNISDTNIDDARQYFNIRYWGAVSTVKYAAPSINPGGSIVLTSGVASLRPQAGWGMGASICAAMEGFTRAMAVELAPVRINLVSPGFVRSPLWDSIPEADREAMYQSVAQSLPVKHVGMVDEIAQTYLYLMRQTFSTGQCVVVDGGAVLV
ncbi:SDR family oxidoreductase [Mucilaginibacter mali]|uniref:SDR family oxidoreductase n=1 Tax=Mucilaginibacter mali TaxID=2740462 RepID=A0A7D4PWH2_9SPHI|nr:SDR family oxidoreductase [Mucilaginibacter mali]QKJ31763.1 SDR family oxidoreductase [Mucilaginibacter mali]